MVSRRSFLGLTGLAFLGLQRYALAEETVARLIDPLGPLLKDPAGILDLPEGFRYRVLARSGETMADGLLAPGLSDGMGAFPGPDGRVILVMNHEIGLNAAKVGPFADPSKLPPTVARELSYDPGFDDEPPHVGGTSTLVFDPAKEETVSHFLSLTGTDRNCAGGVMPWGSWITCEEAEDLTSARGRRHGWCFEVKATAEPALQKPVPLKGLGRFRHEAVSLDDRTGILYLTEDRNDGLLYRFLPVRKNDFTEGRLQALAIEGKPSADLSNYDKAAGWPVERQEMQAVWIDLKDTDTPEDDLRLRGRAAGAARFARGEGIHHTGGSFYICCTDGGPSRRGQIFRLDPSGDAEKPDTLQLFLQPEKSDLLTNGDNICPAPWGGIVICEDLIDPSFAPACHVRCVTPEGKIFTLARNSTGDSEFAGCCFSPDGKWFFVNLQERGLTLAVTGPWDKA